MSAHKRGPALVTGAAGYLGSLIAAELDSSGWEVHRCLSPRVPVSAGVDDSHRHRIDLTDKEEVVRLIGRVAPSAIVHAAGRSDPDLSEASLWAANVDATRHVLTTAAMDRRLRIVIVGSSAVYGVSPGEVPIHEDAPFDPVDAYGRSKVAQEQAAREAIERGADVRVARCFNLVGPALPERLVLGRAAMQIAQAERGFVKSVRLGRLDACRDFVDGRDAARAIRMILELAPAAMTLNVASGCSRQVRWCVDRLIDLARIPISVEIDESRSDRPRGGQCADIERAASLLAWRPQIPILKSLSDLLEECRLRVGSLESGRA